MQPFRRLVEERAIHQLVDALLQQTELARLFRRQLGAEHRRHAVDIAVEAVDNLLGRIVAVTHGDGGSRGNSLPDHVADAPDAEAQDQEGEEDLDDPGVIGLAKGIEHDSLWVSLQRPAS